jgi:multidrug efflux system outer membrane protein
MRTSIHRPVLLAAALALAGCGTLKAPGSAPLGGVTAPADWLRGGGAPAASTTPTDLAAWWQRFGDPALDALIADALAANTDVAQAQANLRQARALARVDAAQIGPRVDGSGSVQRSARDGAGASNQFQAGLDASWELDLFGGKRAGAQAGALDAQTSAATLGDVQVSVTAETALAYLSLRAAELRRGIAQQNLASQQETLQLTQWRVQAGLATSLESEQARAAVEQTRAQSISLDKTIDQTRHALALLTGRTPAQLVLAAGTDLPSAPPELALAIPAQTLAQRADVRAAQARVQAAAQRVTQADAQRLPSVSIGGSIGLSALTLSGLGAGGALASALLGSVSLPIFDGGAARAQVDTQQAAFDSAGAAWRAVVLTALRDVEDALVGLQRDREREATLRLAAQAADNAALLARQRYTSGLVDFQTVLETQRTQLSAQDGVASARADVAADHVRLYKALGGGWNPDGVTS